MSIDLRSRFGLPVAAGLVGLFMLLAIWDAMDRGKTFAVPASTLEQPTQGAKPL